MRFVSWAASCVVAAVLVAGCARSGSVRDPGAAEMSASHSSVGSSLPNSGAPKVRNPLPRSVLAGSACGALTASQVEKTLGRVVPARPGSLPGVGAKCEWTRPDFGSGLTIAFATETHEGLSAVYAGSRPGSEVWRPLPAIQGFPAVAHATIRGETCDVSVGLADDLSVDVIGTLGAAKSASVDSCTVVPQTADLVVTTLRRKAGR